jgi:hypothetical protein
VRHERETADARARSAGWWSSVKTMAEVSGPRHSNRSTPSSPIPPDGSTNKTKKRFGLDFSLYCGNTGTKSITLKIYKVIIVNLK